MKLPLVDKTFGAKPFASTYVAVLSTLDPSPYSLPEPPSSGPSGKAVPAPSSSVVGVTTSLPGSAGHPSMDLADSKYQRKSDNLLCCQPDLLAPRDVNAVHDNLLTDATGASALADVLAAPAPRATPRQQHLKAQPPAVPPLAAPVVRRSPLHFDRDANRARRNYRPSVDASADATVLHTCAAPDTPEPSDSDPSAPGPRLAAAADVPGCVPPASPAPFLHVPPPPPRPAAAAVPSGPLNQWSFGDNAQRARLLARYAAMAAAEEMRYEPSLGSGGGHDSDEGCRDGSPSRRSRSAWKLLSALLGSHKASSGGESGRALASAVFGVQRRQETAAAGTAPGWGHGGDAADELMGDSNYSPAASQVIRSRDSRRLMRVQRTRVAIDREGQQKPAGRASAPMPRQPHQHHLQQQPSLQQLRSRASAPAMLAWDGGEADEANEVNAALLKAAAEFAAATAERRA